MSNTTTSLMEPPSAALPAQAPVCRTTIVYGIGPSQALNLPLVWLHRQFHDWAISEQSPEHASMSFIQGKASIDMSPDNLDFHNLVKTEIIAALHPVVRQSRSGLLFSDGCIFTHEPSELTAMPDGIFVSYEALRAGRIAASSASGKPGLHTVWMGSPDWVLEVVSASSPIKDLIERKEAYFAAGIAEYWIVDARQQELEFMILVRSAEGYIGSSRGEEWFHSGVFKLDFRLTRERDEFGIWNYQVEQRPSQ